MNSQAFDVLTPPSSPKPSRALSTSLQSRACLECRRTGSRCDGVRPVCGTCVSEYGSTRCWLRKARRRKQQNFRHSGAIGSLATDNGDQGMASKFNDTSVPSIVQSMSFPSPSGPKRTFDKSCQCDGSSSESQAEQSLCLESKPVCTPVSHSTVMNLVHLFFEKIQPWMPIFHQPSFLKFCGQRLSPGDDALQDLDLKDRLLFLGIFAMAARFSTLNTAVSAAERGEQFGMHAKDVYDLARDEVEPSLTFLQGCILLAFFYYTSGLSGQGWVIVGVCVRLSYDLALHEIDGDDEVDALQSDPSEIEERRRAWWLVWELDCFGSTVLQRPFAIDQRRWNVRLPMSDEAWFAGRVEYCESTTWEPGQIWQALIGMGSHDERACFLVANVMLSLVIDRLQQRHGISTREKITIENDINCVMLALPPSFDLSAQPPIFNNTSFGRCNWILGTHLLLAATTCLAAEIKVSDGDAQAADPGPLSSTSTGLAHMLKLATIIRNWSPDYISLAHPFLAYALAPILASEPASVRSTPPYPSFYNLATLVQRRFAEKWKVGDIAIDIGTLREKTDITSNETPADLSSLGLAKWYPLYFSSFYKPQTSPNPGGEYSPQHFRSSKRHSRLSQRQNFSIDMGVT